MTGDLVIVTHPSVEPVTAEDCRNWMRVDNLDENFLIEKLVVAARIQAESYLGRAIRTQTWDYFLADFEDVIEVPLPPLQSISSVKYIDTNGVQQTLGVSTYTVDVKREPGTVEPAYSLSWPSVRDVPNAVTIRFVGGWAEEASPSILIPQNIKNAIQVWVAHFFEYREGGAEIPAAFWSLLNPHRILRGV